MPYAELNAEQKRPVLVVDDDVLVRSLIADVLRDADFGVIECGSADEALEVLGSGTLVTLVLSDIRMPGSIDGVGLARVVLRDYQDVKIMLTSSHLPDCDVQCHAFVEKPWDIAKVIRQVSALIDA